MASVNLSTISGTKDIEQLINAIERQRKDIEFLLENLDDDNIKEVSGEKVVNLTIDQAQIKNLLVDSANIKDLAVSSAKIANAAITYAKIQDAAIGNAKIDRASVNKLVVVTADIQDAAISTAKIGDAQITTAKIQSAQIISTHIADAQILTAHIADAQITKAKIAIASIGTAQIEDASITTAKIGNAQITTGLIKDAAITTALIADLAVSDAKIVSITANKLTAGTIDASVINVTNLVADNIVTGTITIASANLLENTTFKTDTSKWVVHAGATRDTAVLFEGVNTIKNVQTGNASAVWRGFNQMIPCTQGEKVVGSIYTMTDDITTLDGRVSFEVIFYNSANSRIVVNGIDCKPTANNTWKRYTSGSFTAPAGTVKAELFAWVEKNGRVWFAKPMLQKGNLATAWQPHTNELLADKGITNLQIGDSAVDNRVITANTITGDRLIADAITTREIKAGSITAASGIIANATIGTAQIIDSAITTAKIGDAQITNAKIANLDAAKITSGFIDAARIKIGANVTFDPGFDPTKIEVGGRNLLKESNKGINSNDYSLADYPLSFAPTVGEEYTISIKGQLGADRDYFGIYNSGGQISLTTLPPSTKGTDGIYRKTFTWSKTQNGFTANDTFLRIYHMVSTDTSASTIEWVKLEKGNRATDWTPAPEDVNEDIVAAESNAKNYADIYKVSATAHQTKNTGNQYNLWTKIGAVKITGQYAYADADISFTGGASGSSVSKWAQIHWRVKQQNPLGTAPYVSIHYIGGYLINADHFKAVTTVNTATETIVELYAFINVSYEQFGFTPMNQVGNTITWYQDQPLITALPVGTQTATEDKSHKPTTELVDGWKYPGTTYIDGGDIYTNSVTANQIASRTILANNIKAGEITANEIKTGSITADRLSIGSSPNMLYKYDQFNQFSSGTALSGGRAGTTTRYHVVASSQSLTGKNVFEHLGTGTDNYNYFSGAYDIGVVTGESYILSAFVCRPYANNAIVQLYANTSNGTHYGTAVTTVVGTDAKWTWQRIFVKFTAQTDAMRVRVDVDTASTTVYWDGFMLEKCSPNQTEPSPWTPAATTIIHGENITTGTVDANVLKANTVIANNIKFTGILEGATGTFSGEVKANTLRVKRDWGTIYGDSGIKLDTGQRNADNTYGYAGTIDFNASNKSLEIYRTDASGNQWGLDSCYINAAVLQTSGTLRSTYSGEAIKIGDLTGSASSLSYMAIYSGSTRLGWYGKGSSTNDMWIGADSGDIKLRTKNGAADFTFTTKESYNHAFLTNGITALKMLKTVATVQVRDNADANYAPINASDFVPASRRALKKNIHSYETNALDQILNTQVYQYHYLSEDDREMPHTGLVYEEAPADAIDPSGSGVSLYGMATMSWKALQQLNAKLEEKVKSLETRIATLEGQAV